MKQFALILLALLFGLRVAAQQPQVQTYHTIQQGETLFRLTQQYKVTAEAICNLNPGLSADNFQAGKTIAIPSSTGEVEPMRTIETIKSNRPADASDDFQDICKVKKKETLYSISVKYGITVEELQDANPETKVEDYVLKKGTYLKIPYHTEKIVQQFEPTTEELIGANRQSLKYDKLNIALVLPFSSTEQSKVSTARLYYQGFMLAVDSLKHEGVNMDITIMDSGKREEKMDSLLRTTSMSKANLILCPQLELSHAKIATYSKSHKIITLVTRSSETENSPYLFVFNPGNEFAYSKVSEHFSQVFSEANIIILDMKDGNSNTQKGKFTKELKEALTAHGLKFKFLSIDSDETAIKAALESSKRNVIVPNSANLTILQKNLLPTWKKFIEAHPGFRISLFGFQEWLTLASEQKANFYALDTYIFSRWWLNPNNAGCKQLASHYHYWFKADMPTKMPSVPVIGFDSSFFMMKGLADYGTDFPYKVDAFDSKPLQSFIDYQRTSNWGGFLNQKVGFIHFNKRVVNVEF